jgi:hypothetical protein
MNFAGDDLIDDDNGVFDEIEKEINNRETLDQDEESFENDLNINTDDEFFLDQDPGLEE